MRLRRVTRKPNLFQTVTSVKKKKKSPRFLGGRRPFCACSESGWVLRACDVFFRQKRSVWVVVVSVSIRAVVSGTRETVARAAVSCPEWKRADGLWELKTRPFYRRKEPVILIISGLSNFTHSRGKLGVRKEKGRARVTQTLQEQMSAWHLWSRFVSLLRTPPTNTCFASSLNARKANSLYKRIFAVMKIHATEFENTGRPDSI